MIFKIAYKKDNNTLVKIAGLDPTTEAKDKKDGTWANCSANVYNWAKKNYKEGDEVNVEYSVNNGQYNVTRITKGSGDSKRINDKKTKNTSVPTCEDCGKELKDSKYTKCYTCNKKNPSKKKGSSNSYSKSPEDKEQIRRLSVLRAVAEAIQVMTGQIDNVDTLGTMMETLYDKFYKKVSE